MDKTLLDRLNALKPTTVTLQGQPLALSSTFAQDRTQPVSGEDALSDRLKTLRARQEPGAPASFDQGRAKQSSSIKPDPAHPSVDDPGDGPLLSPDRPVPVESETLDDLLVTDDQTLIELLNELHEDDAWLEQVAQEVEHGDDHQRVVALLNDIQNDTSQRVDGKGPHTKGENGEDSDDDDSDGEQIGRETREALDQAFDEVAWEKGNAPDQGGGTTLSQFGADHRASESAQTSKTDGTNFEDTPSLPAVPSDLQDQRLMSNETEDDDGFAANIASRMAALKGLGSSSRGLPSAPTSQVDELGLPVVPSFAPGDRPVKGIVKRAGYTDEDQRTWCIVCLEDGTIRCLGCDDDVYCARCWKEMHIGPSAGCEERGHRWENFTRERS